MAKRKTDAPVDPDALVRQSAGNYRSGDDRFEVREADAGWFLVDGERSNEFGQELIHGPYPTLKAVRGAIPGARAAKASAKPTSPRGKKASAAKKDKAPKASPQPPPSWIDELSRAEGTSVRRLIRALEGEGVKDAEELVRRDRDGLLPAVAARLIQRRLDSLADELPEKAREGARALISRAAEILTSDGSRKDDPLPGWALIEIGSEPAPPHRRIDLRE